MCSGVLARPLRPCIGKTVDRSRNEVAELCVRVTISHVRACDSDKIPVRTKSLPSPPEPMIYSGPPVTHRPRPTTTPRGPSPASRPATDDPTFRTRSAKKVAQAVKSSFLVASCARGPDERWKRHGSSSNERLGNERGTPNHTRKRRPANNERHRKK